jgi:hypothetical protein
MILAINEDSLKELYEALTEKILEAGNEEGKAKDKEDEAWWSGYAEAVIWVRNDLLELEKPEGAP